MINKEYLTKAKQREIIREWEEGEEIKDIAVNIQEPTKLVNDFLKNNGYETNNYKYGYEVHGHIQYANYFNLYEHQIVMMKELKIKVGDIKKYLVHHLQKDSKQDNDITNLWLFWDKSIHRVYHGMLERGEVGQDIDSIYLFTKEYMYNVLADLQRDRQECIIFSDQEFQEIEKDINTYMKLVEKLYKKQKKILVSVETN
jgi:hypothetical protein